MRYIMKGKGWYNGVREEKRRGTKGVKVVDNVTDAKKRKSRIWTGTVRTVVINNHKEKGQETSLSTTEEAAFQTWRKTAVYHRKFYRWYIYKQLVSIVDLNSYCWRQEMDFDVSSVTFLLVYIYKKENSV